MVLNVVAPETDIKARRVIVMIALLVLWSLVTVTNLLWSLPVSGYKDFGSFYASGKAASEGLDPYGVHPLTFRVRIGDVDVVSPNLNPPLSVTLFEPLSLLGPQVSFRLWYVVSLGIGLTAVAMLARATRASLWKVVWAVGTAGFWHTLELGQIYMPLLLLFAIAWLSLEQRRWLTAGLAMGLLIALKPTFALWPVALVAAGYLAPGAIAAGSAAAVSLVPGFQYGWGIFASWASVLGVDTGLALSLNASLPGFAARLGVTPIGFVVGACLLVAIGVWCWRLRPPLAVASELTICGLLLASPLTWPGYTLFLLPTFFRQSWSRQLWVAAVLLTVPVLVIILFSQSGGLSNIIAGTVYTAALVLVFIDAMRRALGERRLAIKPRSNASQEGLA